MDAKDVIKTLVDEALEDPETGWLSDLGGFDLEYDERNASIVLEGWGSIDIGHLAGIVESMISGDEG